MSQPQQQNQQKSPSPPSSSHSSQQSDGSLNEDEAVRRVTLMELTWEEAVSESVLPVRCKDTNGELHKDKFGSGGKGKSIKCGDLWFTPSEFEVVCGRGNSKDWRRSIRFGGRTLQSVIQKGFLIPHASSCNCGACMSDSEATGPVRPYVPYQRKKRAQQGDETSSFKLGRFTLTPTDSVTDDSSDVATLVTPCGITSAMNPLTESLLKIRQSSPPTTEEAWKNLEDMVDTVAESALLVKHMVKEMKERATQETESLRCQLQEKESLQNLYRLATVAQTHQPQQQVQSDRINGDRINCNVIESPQILGILQSGGIQTYSFQLLDSEALNQLQATQPVCIPKVEP